MSLQDFTGQAQELLGDRLVALYQFGSNFARGPKSKKAHLLMLVADLKAPLLRDLRPIAKLARSANYFLRIDTANDVLCSADVFPIFMLELIDTKELIFGTDVLDKLEVRAEHLRAQAEQSLRALHRDLLTAYITDEDNHSLVVDLRQVLRKSVYVLRAIAIAQGIELPKLPTAEQLIDDVIGTLAPESNRAVWHRMRRIANFVSALGAVHDKLWAIELPFLFRDYDHADAVWNGPAAKMLMAGMSDVGLRGLAFAYSGGFRIVATEERELHSIADYKGLRLRTAGNPVPEALYKSLGGTAIGAPLEQISHLHDAGEIDGCEITFVRYQASGLDKRFPVLNVTGHSLFTTMTVMNDKWFRSLPDRHQATVVEAGEAACQVERKTAIGAESATQEHYKDRGYKIVRMAQPQHNELREISSKLQTAFAPRFGEELIGAISGA